MRLMRGGTARRLESVKHCGIEQVQKQPLQLKDLIGGRVSTVGSRTTPLGKPRYNMGNFPGYGLA